MHHIPLGFPRDGCLQSALCTQTFAVALKLKLLWARGACLSPAPRPGAASSPQLWLLDAQTESCWACKTTAELFQLLKLPQRAYESWRQFEPFISLTVLYSLKGHISADGCIWEVSVGSRSQVVFKNSELSRILNPFQLSSHVLQPLCFLRNFGIYQLSESTTSQEP